jgi:hypothetical protein
MAYVITHLVLWRKRSQHQPDKSADSELLTLPHAQTELHSHDAVSLTEEGEAANSELLTIPHSQGGLYPPSTTTFTEDVEAAESELSTVAHAQGMVYPPNAASFAKEREVITPAPRYQPSGPELPAPDYYGPSKRLP